MAKIIDNLKEQLLENVLTETEIDAIMEKEKYYPIESDTEQEEGILKYSNGKSQVWVKYIYSEGEYLVLDITMKTKKSGSTKKRHLTIKEIVQFMTYFREQKKYDEFMIFMLELLLARRIGDTLSLDLSHFYYENGNRRSTLKPLVEDKTDKIANIHITDVVWKYLEEYFQFKKINPTKHLSEDLFFSEHKIGVKKYLDDGIHMTQTYKNAIEKQESAFRYEFTKAAKILGVDGVGTHSIRKSFGNIAHMINQFDPDCLDVLQSVYVHDSRETTKIYIDIIDDKAKKFYGDVSNYVYDADNGIEPCIDNIPVVAIKSNSLRDILLKAYNLGMENSSVQDANVHMKIMNQLISEVEKIRVQ